MGRTCPVSSFLWKKYKINVSIVSLVDYEIDSGVLLHDCAFAGTVPSEQAGHFIATECDGNVTQHLLAPLFIRDVHVAQFGSDALVQFDTLYRMECGFI